MKEETSLVTILQRIKEKYKYPEYIFPDGAVRRDLHICVSILNELKSCVSVTEIRWIHFRRSDIKFFSRKVTSSIL